VYFLQERSNHRPFSLGGRSISILATVFVASMLLASQLSSVSAAATSAAPRTPAAAAQTANLSQSILLRRDTYQSFELDSFSSNTTVTYAVASSAPISVALMTGAQYDAWQNNLTDPISNSITYKNGTDVQNTQAIQPGQYFLVFYAYQTRAFVQFGFQVYPSTPYSYGPAAAPLASGIASFGISNSSGKVSSYEVRTSQLVGTAKIASLQVNTANASLYGVNTSGASLQLNAMLVVNDSGASSQKVYWVQNVPDFVTAASKVSFGDEIWNNTDNAGFLSNQTITSTNFQNGGFVYQSGRSGQSGGPNLYSFVMNNASYSLPLGFGLLMKAAVLPRTGVLVQLGYRLLSNGSAVSSPTNWFDNVTVVDPSAQTAYFDITGNSTTPTGHYYDAELVFAGEGNLEPAYFTQLNATLGLFYQSRTNGALSSFPTYYGFSGDTGEAASNLVVTYTNGLAHLSPGDTPNYAYLGSASLTLDPGSLTITPPTTIQTTTTTTSVSSGSTTTSRETATPTTTGVSTTSMTTTEASTSSRLTSSISSFMSASTTIDSSTSSSQPLELPKSDSSQPSAGISSYVPVAVVAAIVGLMIAILGIDLTRKRSSQPLPL